MCCLSVIELDNAIGVELGRSRRFEAPVAERHRDEFRAVAEYLNTLAELDREEP